MLFERQKFQEDCVANIANIIERGIDFSNNDYSGLEGAVKEHYSVNGYSRFKTNGRKRLDVVMGDPLILILILKEKHELPLMVPFFFY